MADEIIVIEIQDKISSSIGSKITAIANDAIAANAAIVKLQTNLSKISLNAIRLEKLALAQNKTKMSAEQLSAAADRAALAHLRLEQAQKRAANSTKLVENANKSTSNSFAAMGQKLLGAAAVYLSIREVVELGNAYVGLTNKLRVVTTSEAQLSEVSSRLFDIANRSRGPIEETAAAFSRFDLALKPIGRSQEEVLRMTETVNKAMTVAGATTGEQAAGLLQLSQAFNKGKLDGDEFRTVMELMPSVADAIAKQMKVTRGELLLLAPQGKITADILAKALAGAADEIDTKFAKTVPTLSQAMTVLRNNFVAAAGEFEKGGGIFSSVANSIIGISKAIDENKVSIFELGSTVGPTLNAVGDLAATMLLLDGSTNKTENSLSSVAHVIRGLGLITSFLSDALRVGAADVALFFGTITQFTNKKNNLRVWGENALYAKSSLDTFLDSVEKTDAAIAKMKAPKDPFAMLSSHGPLRPTGTSTAPNTKIDTGAIKNELTRSQTLAKINAELAKEAGTLQLLSPEREIYNRYTEIEIQLANKKLAGNKIGIKAKAEELAGIKAQITANEHEKKIAEERNKIYNDSIGPAQNYNNTVVAAGQLLAKNLITHDEYNKRLLIANETYASLTNPMYEFNKQIEQEGYLLGFTGMQLEVENRLMQLRNELVSKGVKDVEVSLLLERKTIEALVLKNRVTQESQNLMSSLGLTVEEFKIKQLSLNDAMAKVNDPGQKAALTVAAFSEVLSATQLGLDAELAMYKKHYEDISKLQATGIIDVKTAEQAKFSLKNKSREKDFQNADKFFGNMASLQNSSSRELFEIGKAAAIAQATLSGYESVQNALAVKPAWVGIALAASVGVMTASNIAGIMNTKMAGYEKGGLVTGGEQTIRINERGQEFVMNAASTAKHRPVLEAMNRGGSIPSVGKGGAQILIQNYGTSKTFEVEQLDENRYRVIARDEANQAIRRELPALNASEIGNANSRTSKALSQHTTVGRRNG